ncbi:MAG TPA: hypothetical protein VF652_06915 [Allosphingosinicella sp.]
MSSVRKSIDEAVRRRSPGFAGFGAVLALSLAASAVIPASPAEAQMYDPLSGASPLSLLDGPSDPLAYYRMKARVRALVAVSKHSYSVEEGEVAPGGAAAAEPLAEALVRAYPRDSENWLLLATAKKLLKKHREAAAAYEREGAISGWDPSSAVNAAVSHLAAGDKRSAMDILRRQIVERGTADRFHYFRIEGLKALRDDPEFLELVGRPDSSGWTRDEGWRNDIAFLVAEIERANSEYRGRPLPTDFLAAIEKLKRNVPTSSNEKILVEMNRALALLHQGHTDLWEPKGDGPIPGRILPVTFHLFPEGLFVVNAAPQHRDLIGSKVAAIGGTPALEALRKVAETISGDGDMEYVWKGAYLTSYAPFLKGLGILDTLDSAELTLEGKSAGRRKIVLQTTSDLSWFNAAAPGKQVVSLNGHQGIQYHSERAVPEHDALYVQFNQVRDDKEERLAAFGQRLDGVIRESGAKNIVLDIRFNAGGSTATYSNLLRTLIGFSLGAGNRIYVLTGRRTYSAASNFITELERLANPIFVGEPPSQCCNLNGDFSSFVLPWSKVGGTMPVVKWNLSHPYDARREIVPQVPVQLTAEDYFSGRDTVVETTYRLIDEKRRAGGGRRQGDR